MKKLKDIGFNLIALIGTLITQHFATGYRTRVWVLLGAGLRSPQPEWIDREHKNLNENVMVPHRETCIGTITLSSQPSSPSREMMQRAFDSPVFELTAKRSILSSSRNH